MALIAPGLAYEALWEKRHPSRDQSTFREAGRTVLTSLLFISLSSAILALLRLRWPRFLFDPGEIVRGGAKFISDNFSLTIWALAIYVGLALVLVALAHLLPVWINKLPNRCTRRMPNWMCARWRGQMTSEGIWFDVFRKNVPLGKAAWVQVRLTDGSYVKGYVAAYTPASTPEKREICIQKPADGAGDMRIHDLKMKPPNQNLKGRWDYVIVRGDDISYMRVAYQDG